jgi:hypothetical protein
LSKATRIVVDGLEMGFTGGVDFSDMQESLADIITETATRARVKLFEVLSLYEGVAALLAEATPATRDALRPAIGSIVELVDKNVPAFMGKDLAIGGQAVVA